MKSAIEAVQKKELSVRKAAIAFSVPKDALHRRIKGKLTSIPVEQLHKKCLSLRRNFLTENKEEELAMPEEAPKDLNVKISILRTWMS